jgi:heat shock protein HslJ
VTNPTAPSGQTPAATIDQVAGSWTTTSVLGRPVSATGPAWTIQFAGKGHAGTWQATDGCNQFSGGLTVGPAGTFEASVAASTMKLCSGVVVGPNVAIITTTRHVTVEQGAPAQLSVFDGQGRLLGTYKAQP